MQITPYLPLLSTIYYKLIFQKIHIYTFQTTSFEIRAKIYNLHPIYNLQHLVPTCLQSTSKIWGKSTVYIEASSPLTLLLLLVRYYLEFFRPRQTNIFPFCAYRTAHNVLWIYIGFIFTFFSQLYSGVRVCSYTSAVAGESLHHVVPVPMQPGDTCWCDYNFCRTPVVIRPVFKDVLPVIVPCGINFNMQKLGWVIPPLFFHRMISKYLIR